MNKAALLFVCNDSNHIAIDNDKETLNPKLKLV
jgi:hypothetical protein